MLKRDAKLQLTNKLIVLNRRPPSVGTPALMYMFVMISPRVVQASGSNGL